MKMTREEMLMAYADDALPPEDRAAVEASLRSDAEARELVEMFRATKSLSALAFAAPMSEEPPQRLINAALGAKVVAFEPKPRRRASLPYLALAAGIACAAVVAAGALLMDGGDGGELADLAPGSISGDHPIASLLETRPSGSRLTVGARAAAVTGTFRDASRRICREVEVFPAPDATQPEAAAVACRGRDGWSVEATARIAARPAAGDAYVPSGADGAHPLEGALTALGAGPAFTAAEEASALNSGWKN
ncbi:MAG: hypothetical protein NW215_11495 [Hyphomicrobiales bacterium]|nr:hypothetical protein [Hyphomicrobiales bacterium]